MRQQNAQNFVHADDIDLNRGFAWDEKTKKLWIDLRELVDLTSLIINPQTGKLVVNPEPVDNLTKALNAAKDELDDKINDLSQEVTRKELSILENLKIALEALKTSLTKVSSDYTDAEVAKVKQAIDAVKEQVAAGITLGSRSGLTGKGTTTEPLQLDLNVGSTLQGNGKDTALNLADEVTRKINQLGEAVQALQNEPKVPETLAVDIARIKQGLSEAQNDITNLKRPCSVAVRSASGGTTIAEGDGYVFVDGGEVLVPATLHVGFQCTVVQTGTTDVVLKGQNADVIAPYEGSLTLAGANAAVVLVHVEQGKFRLFGQTK